MTQLDTRPTTASAEPQHGSVNGWSPGDAAALYGLPRWGGGYFGVNEDGHVTVRPGRDAGPRLDLHRMVGDLQQRGLRTPILLRFPDVLGDRLGRLADAFADAIAERGYAGGYRGVYPIKVNQQRHVVGDLIRHGKPRGFGLEAGSKPELLAVLALCPGPETLIVANGFKDRAFLEAVVLGQKIGQNVVPVIERAAELPVLIERAAAHGVRPRLGLRVKLAAAGSGRWHATGGPRSKFGLTAGEVLDAVTRLRQHDALGGLNLLHFHLGSQIEDLPTLESAVTEAARLYVELARLGAGLDTLDVGGGLGVDYGQGVGYDLRAYADTVVEHVGGVCRDAGVAPPTIVTEAGRAMTAHHSVLVFDVVGRSETANSLPLTPSPDTAAAEAALRRVQARFNRGDATLAQRASVERRYAAAPDASSADTLFGNVSVFQSLPDSWAIDQLFPVLPIHRLGERPTRRAVVADLTCDSDGVLDRFPLGGEQPSPTLPVHADDGQPYRLGVFLVGAYQETLGDLHNLFGDTDAVHVALDADGRPHVEEVVRGDTVADVLRYVQYDPGTLVQRYDATLAEAIRGGHVTGDEATAMRRFYTEALSGTTYLT
ncbi:MAG: biosynthetic arginine decarboxylase [Planctomycetota bacterium]